MGTQTGTNQFNKMVDASHPITLKIDNETVSNKLGNASISLDPVTLEVNKVDVTIYEATIEDMLENNPSFEADVFRSSTEDIDQAIGAVAGHEAEHAADEKNLNMHKENIRIDPNLNSKDAIEAIPTRIMYDILREQRMINRKNKQNSKENEEENR